MGDEDYNTVVLDDDEKISILYQFSPNRHRSTDEYDHGWSEEQIVNHGLEGEDAKGVLSLIEDRVY